MKFISPANRLLSIRKSPWIFLIILLFNTADSWAQRFIDQSVELGVISVPQTHAFGSGMSTYDFDNDGWDDISICNDLGPLFFYRNTGGTGFELINYGLLAPGSSKMLLWVDYDNDGLLDVFLTTQGGRNVLYKNMGDFVFEDHTEEAGLPITEDLNDGASFGDYDRDGYLDLYICKYANFIGAPVNSVRYNKLYHNNGNGTFTDVTVVAGVEQIPHYSLQSVFVDVNNDNWPDIHVINDRAPGNFMFINNQDGTFTEVAEQFAMSFPNHCVMSNSISDFDHDGDLDIFMTNNGALGHPSLLARNDFQQGVFPERGELHGLDLYDFTWGAAWLDANNDTWDDVICALPYANPNRYFERTPGDFFVDTENEIQVTQEYTSYTPSPGDFNNDGYMDVAIHCTQPNHPYVLMNTGGDKNFAKVTLNGTISNKEAIGSWIKLYANSKEYIKYTICGENYHGQGSQHKHFGLANAPIIDSLSVLYPSGHIDWYYGLPANASYNLTEGETFQIELSTSGPPSFCPGDSILIDAGIHDNYLWSNGAESQTIWANTAGTFTVQTQNELGIIAMDSISIIENQNPVISSTLTMPLCAGDSTGSIAVTNIIEVAPDSIVWSTGQISDTLQSIPAGNYGYTYYDINGCSSSGSAIILEPTAMQFFANSTPDISESNNGTISISIFGGTAPYEIYLEGDLVEDFITGLSAGDYTFNIIDANGCESELNITVESILSTTISSRENAVEIFPNPFRNTIQIKSDVETDQIQITDINGKTVYTSQAGNTAPHDVSHLSKGVYVLSLKFKNKTSSVYRLVKQ